MKATAIVAVLLLAGCSTAAPIKPDTGYVLDRPLTFRSGGERFSAPVGASVVGPGVREMVARLGEMVVELSVRLRLKEIECEHLVMQLQQRNRPPMAMGGTP